MHLLPARTAMKQARLDEQALGVLIRIKLSADPLKLNAEWQKLMRGVRNNQPHVLAEWTELRGIISQKHGMRERFGIEGDRLRREGWGLWNMGPLTQSIMIRFMIKLSKALYYRHNGVLFDGWSCPSWAVRESGPSPRKNRETHHCRPLKWGFAPSTHLLAAVLCQRARHVHVIRRCCQPRQRRAATR